MSFQQYVGAAPLNYFPCRYGTSKLTLRGPRRRLNGPYAAFLGGVETYGKFIPLPYPTLVEHQTGLKCVNLGYPNIGIETYLTDSTLLNIARDSLVTVIELTGAQNMSNRFYKVHPRRNDRFICPSERLNAAFPETDFTEFTFTRHLLLSLAEASPERFTRIEEELKTAWMARMTKLIHAIGRPVVLVWLADHLPGQSKRTDEPMFIDQQMIRSLPNVLDIVEIVPTAAEKSVGLEEMVFSDLDAPAASELAGPVAHKRLAAALSPVLAPFKPYDEF